MPFELINAVRVARVCVCAHRRLTNQEDKNLSSKYQQMRDEHELIQTNYPNFHKQIKRKLILLLFFVQIKYPEDIKKLPRNFRLILSFLVKTMYK